MAGKKGRYDSTICGAKRPSDGLQCRRPAGAGTDHKGVGPCHYHGGNETETKMQIIKGDLMMLVGREMQVTPAEALMSCIRITAAEIMYFEMKISQLTDSQVTQRLSSQQLSKNGSVHELKGERQLNIWIKERAKSVDRLAKYAKMAMDVGIESKKVQIAERYGEVLATALQRIFSRLEITPTQKVMLPDIIREELAQIETQSMLRNPLSHPIAQTRQRMEA